MPNLIKYNASTESLALRKGNFYIGTGDVPKGPPNNGWFNGIDPPGATAYTIYLNKSSDGPSIYQVGGGADIQSLASRISGQSLTTDASAIDYFMATAGTDRMIINRNIGPIVTNGLQFAVDERSTLCWNGISGTDVWSMAGNNAKNDTPYTWSNSNVSSWANSASALTVCCLIKLRSTPGSDVYPINKLNTTTANASFALRVNSSRQLTWLGPGASAYTPLGTLNFATLTQDQTAWVGLQFNSTTGGLAWLNGVSTGSRGGTGNLGNGTGDLSINQIPYSNSNCEIIQALFYNRELTDAEMYQNYQASIAPPVGSFYGGGIVFATLPSGTTGATGTAFIVANVDSSPRVAWTAAKSMSINRSLSTVYGSLMGSNGEFYSKDNTDAIKDAYGSDAPGIDWALGLNTGGYDDWSMANFGAAVAIHNNVWKPNLRVGSVFNETNFPPGAIQVTFSTASIQISNKGAGAGNSSQLQFITPTLDNFPKSTGQNAQAGVINAVDTELKVWAVRSQTYSVTDVT